MKHRTLAAAASASVIAFTMLGAGIASAHGWGAKIDPQEAADRHAAMFEEQAALLGIDAAAVKDAWSQGKDLRELAEEKGITDEELKTRMDARRKERHQAELQALVAKGVITQSQADARLATMERRAADGRGRPHGMMKIAPRHRPGSGFSR